jgi:hypothetical protein
MPQVLDALLGEEALGALEVEVVVAQRGEDNANMLDVLRPRPAVDEMSSKNTRTKRRRKGRSTSFIRAWNVQGAFVGPKGITKNSK